MPPGRLAVSSEIQEQVSVMKGALWHDGGTLQRMELKEKLPWKAERLACDLVCMAEDGSWGEAVSPNHRAGSCDPVSEPTPHLKVE